MSLMDNKKATILITGGQGWLGLALGEYLSDLGFSDVKSLAGFRAGIDLGLDSVLGWALDVNPDIVIHLANRPPTRENSLDYPAGLMYENLHVTTRLMEEASQSGCKKFITVNESCVYPERQILPYKEKDLFEGPPHWTCRYYGTAARALMEMNMAFSTQYDDFIGVNIISPEVYGPGSRFNPKRNRVMEAAISNIGAAHKHGLDEVNIEGPKSASRDFIFVNDFVDAIYHAIEFVKEPDTINISQGYDINIKALHEKIAEIIGYEGKVNWQDKKEEFINKLYLDITRAEKVRNWKPKHTLETGLEYTLDWYSETMTPDYVDPTTLLLQS